MTDNTGTKKTTATKTASTKKKGEFFVAKSNILIQNSRFSMTMQQNKFLLYLISKIKPNDTGDEIHSISIMEFCELCGINSDSGKNREDAKKALQSIADKSVWVKQENGNQVLLRWLDRVKLNNSTNCFEVTFHKDMLPYLYDLKERYTSYRLENIITMNSQYSIRLYELLKSYQYKQEKITITLAELKTRLDAEKYKEYSDFRRFVIEKAVSDINLYSDMSVSFVPVCSDGGRATDNITFTVRKMSAIELKARKGLF